MFKFPFIFLGILSFFGIISFPSKLFFKILLLSSFIVFIFLIFLLIFIAFFLSNFDAKIYILFDFDSLKTIGTDLFSSFSMILLLVSSTLCDLFLSISFSLLLFLPLDSDIFIILVLLVSFIFDFLFSFLLNSPNTSRSCSSNKLLFICLSTFI